MIRKQFIVIFLLFSLAYSISYSQTEVNTYRAKQFITEGEDLIEQPLEWKEEDWLKLGLVITGTYGLMQIDNEAKNYLQKFPEHKYSLPVEFGRVWGEPFFSVLVGAAFFLQGNAAGNLKNKKLGFEIEQSLFYTLFATGITKLTFGRARPYTDEGPFSFSLLSRQFSRRSLSSGHTSSAFSLSTVLAENTDKDLLKIIYYLPAFLTAFSRVYQNYHWTSDVFLGAFTGIFIAKFLTDLHEKKVKEISVPQTIFKISFEL